MAVVVSYDAVLELVAQLSPEEQARLVKTLTDNAGNFEQDRIEAALADLDRLTEQVCAAWKDEMSAADTVKEQRREL